MTRYYMIFTISHAEQYYTFLFSAEKPEKPLFHLYFSTITSWALTYKTDSLFVGRNELFFAVSYPFLHYSGK